MAPKWHAPHGDVNSTVAAALVCAKLLVPVAHIEAGLRSFDRTMPEEINRIVTDQLADVLFTPSADGDENLLRELAGIRAVSNWLGNNPDARKALSALSPQAAKVMGGR